MKFDESIKYTFRNYAKLRGRASRSEFWYWTLYNLLVDYALSSMDAKIFGKVFVHQYCEPLTLIFDLVTFMPSLAVGVRRLHDVNRSALWYMTIIMPLIWSFFPGTKGANYYGPDPLTNPKKPSVV